VKSESPAPATVAAPPAAKPAAGVTAKPAKSPAGTQEARPSEIRVKEGDTLASLGRKYGVTAAALMMENNLVTESIKVGQVLKIPPQR
jgi:LysM repeat protein